MTEGRVSEGLERFLNYLRTTEELHRMAEANQTEAEAATQDLLHALELENHSSKEQTQMARKLREVRRARRISKDAAEQSGPVADWVNQNQGTIKGLERLLGEVRKVERRAENRVYAPRTRVLEELLGKERPE